MAVLLLYVGWAVTIGPTTPHLNALEASEPIASLAKIYDGR